VVGLIGAGQVVEGRAGEVEAESIRAARSEPVRNKLRAGMALAWQHRRRVRRPSSAGQARWKPVIASAQIKPE